MYRFIGSLILLSCFVHGTKIIGPKCFGRKNINYEIDEIKIDCPTGRIKILDVFWGQRKDITLSQLNKVCPKFSQWKADKAEDCTSLKAKKTVQKIVFMYWKEN